MREEYARLMDQFVEQINAAEYYKAHETLEEIWFPRRFEDNDEIKLIKGFINAAVSFELIKKGRPKASIEKVWNNYHKYKVLLGTFESPFNSRYEELAQFLEQKRAELVSES